MSISAIATRLAAALLPQRCLLCGIIGSDASVCEECRGDLPRLPADRCPRCALPTPGGDICGECLRRPPNFDAVVAEFFYAFPIDKLIQDLKYAHRLAIADFFAGELLRHGLPAASIVIPLPLSAARLSRRGFNQAAEIARPLARSLGVPLQVDGCIRVVDTLPQAMLPWKARRRNVCNAFSCSLDLTDLTVLAVDDVITTGATLDEFARVLKDRGAAGVIACAAARTVRGEHA